MVQVLEDWVTFDRYSEQNAAIIYDKITSRCGCRPYQDVFTFGLWKKMGRYVKRGEHGVRIGTVIESVDDDGQTRRYSKGTWVFCRCQTEAR